MNKTAVNDNARRLVTVPVYIALLHTPVVNRKGAIVTTAVTNMDIHDISRSAKTYGMKGYFIVTPIEDQHELVGRILGHWATDRSKTYHPDRFEAVSLVRLVHTFEEVKAAIRLEHGEDPEVVLTDARPIPNALSYAEYKAELASPSRSKKPVLVVFGTGWGISDVFYPEVHRILAPVYGPGGAEGYNHLSVRAAVAIILDRLFGH
ncbi:MAG: RNA methyltransferase [Bdellovibrionia bacterium]